MQAERSIFVGGLDDTPDWGALAVQGTRSVPRNVHLEHVIIRGGSGVTTPRTIFTAPLAVVSNRVSGQARADAHQRF